MLVQFENLWVNIICRESKLSHQLCVMPCILTIFDRDINCLIWKGGIYLNRCLSWRCMQLLILHCLILMYLSVWEMSLTEVHAVYVHCALITIKAIREDKNFLSNKLLEKWFATYLLRNHLKSMTWPFLKIWFVSFQTYVWDEDYT